MEQFLDHLLLGQLIKACWPVRLQANHEKPVFDLDRFTHLSLPACTQALLKNGMGLLQRYGPNNSTGGALRTFSKLSSKICEIGFTTRNAQIELQSKLIACHTQKAINDAIKFAFP